MAAAPAKPKFFKTPALFRAWLEKNHAKETELWIGYYKKASGKGGMVYKEALDEALCFGWIDGVVNSIDADTYMQRWTPRKSTSHWSLVNVRRFGELDAEGRIAPPGRAAFDRKTPERTGQASFEQPEVELSPAQMRELKANKKGWAFWNAMAPTYRRVVKHWVTRAKQEATRERRFQTLLECNAKGLKVPPYRVDRFKKEP
jgi:uncharacterized protein YdeI (YjbR/CyaY-like superfamily)